MASQTDYPEKSIGALCLRENQTWCGPLAAADYLQGKEVPDHRPHRFIDSDLYKVMEGAAYLAQLQDDPELEAQFDKIVDVIVAAQEPNGYLYPSHTTKDGTDKSMMGNTPYTFVVHSHELYNMGHLYEAAIAYYLATGKDKLLKVLKKMPNM